MEVTDLIFTPGLVEWTLVRHQVFTLQQRTSTARSAPTKRQSEPRPNAPDNIDVHCAFISYTGWVAQQAIVVHIQYSFNFYRFRLHPKPDNQATWANGIGARELTTNSTSLRGADSAKLPLQFSPYTWSIFRATGRQLYTREICCIAPAGTMKIDRN